RSISSLRCRSPLHSSHPNRSAQIIKDVLRLHACHPIAPRWLTRRKNLFPVIDPVSHDRIDGLLKVRCCLVGGDREEAGRLFGEDFSRFRDRDVFSLPANAAKTKTENLV